MPQLAAFSLRRGRKIWAEFAGLNAAAGVQSIPSIFGASHFRSRRSAGAARRQCGPFVQRDLIGRRGARLLRKLAVSVCHPRKLRLQLPQCFAFSLPPTGLRLRRPHYSSPCDSGRLDHRTQFTKSPVVATMDDETAYGELHASSLATDLASTKPRRPPTITPKRFTRFFTPRQSVLESRKSKHMSKAARSLRDITKNAINRKQKSPLRHLAQVPDDNDLENLTPRHKRRKLTPILDSSPIQVLSSPSKHADQDFCHIQILDDDTRPSIEDDDDIDDDVSIDGLCRSFERLPKPIRRLNGSHTAHRVLERSFGGRTVLGRSTLR